MISETLQYLYFMKPVGMDGPIKIGCSTVPLNRLITIGLWSPFPLEIIGTVPGGFKDEYFLHRCFMSTHSHHEWFYSSPALREIIARLIETQDFGIARATLNPGDGPKKKRLRKKRTPEETSYYSYSARVRCAASKLRKQLGDEGAWCTPDDVHEIISEWDRGARPISAEQKVRLDTYLADPASHSVIWEWFHKRKAAA